MSDWIFISNLYKKQKQNFSSIWHTDEGFSNLHKTKEMLDLIISIFKYVADLKGKIPGALNLKKKKI